MTNTRPTPIEILLPNRLYRDDTLVYKYFVDRDKLMQSSSDLDANVYADGEEVHNLLVMAIGIINRSSMNRDMDFVKNSVKEMLLSMQHTVSENNVSLSVQIDQLLKLNFDENVDGSYLQVVKSNLKEQLKESNTSIKETIDLLLENVEKLSTDKMTDVESKLKTLQDKLNPELETSYLGILKKSVKDVQDNIDAQFEPTNTESFINKLEIELEKIGAEDSPLVAEVQSIMDAQQKIMNEKFGELRDMISKEEGKEEMIESTAQMKGQRFEDVLFTDLEKYAKPFGDTVIETGTKAEVGGSKKGDFVYEFSKGKRIVIEAKDTPVGLAPMLKYLNEAMKTRDCTFSILVTRDESLMAKQIGAFNFYDDNKLFVTADFLSQALSWSRLYLNKVLVEQVEGIDKSVVDKSLLSIQQQIKTFATIKSKLTKMNKAVNITTQEIGLLLEQTQENISDEILTINQEVQSD